MPETPAYGNAAAPVCPRRANPPLLLGENTQIHRPGGRDARGPARRTRLAAVATGLAGPSPRNAAPRAAGDPRQPGEGRRAKTGSIITGAARGRALTATTERGWRPASGPNSATSSSEAPSATAEIPSKPGAQAT